jgi:hypothetical protein
MSMPAARRPSTFAVKKAGRRGLSGAWRYGCARSSREIRDAK